MKKNEHEKFVQTIPYGRPLLKSKIRVNHKGEVVIYGKQKIWHVKDIDAAIRQQLFHVLFHYEDAILLKPRVKHSGEISRMENIIQSIGSLLKSVGTIQDVKSLKDKIVEFKNNLQNMELVLTNRERQEMTIVKKILTRAEHLMSEKNRCNKIILDTLNILLNLVDKINTKQLENFCWNDYFTCLKNIKTITVNPYKQKTQLRLFKKLQYEIYGMIKIGKENIAQKLLWNGIEKLIPLSPVKLPIRINEQKFTIENGKIILK